MSRIAILTHSTNPRGGVVHALELGDALTALDHDVTVHAPDPKGAGFFRSTLCHTMPIAVAPALPALPAMVAQRAGEYVRHFNGRHRDFDIYHAQDSISGNALAAMRARGLIASFCRTVHHIDTFDDPRLTELQANSITSAARHFVVSRTWQARLAEDFQVTASNVGNGVNAARYTPLHDGTEAALRQRLGVGDAGPVFLSVGGVEPRKNSRRILAAYRQLQKRHPAAQLLIAGGASLLDHHAYQAAFAADLAAAALPEHAVVLSGPLPDSEMPALYRTADALVFPSLAEGFGLAVLEAMASGLPVVTSRIAPFTEYLDEEDAAWCNPDGHGIHRRCHGGRH